jgi:hypothetical protein
MKTFFTFLCLFIGSLAAAQQRVGTDTTVLAHLLVDHYQLNPVNSQVAIPEHLRSSFVVEGQFPNQAILVWDNERENLAEEIKVSVFNFIDWSLVGEPIVVKTAPQQWVLPITPEIANLYIVQIDQLDGSPITLFKFDWGVE